MPLWANSGAPLCCEGFRGSAFFQDRVVLVPPGCDEQDLEKQSRKKLPNIFCLSGDGRLGKGTYRLWLQKGPEARKPKSGPGRSPGESR